MSTQGRRGPRVQVVVTTFDENGDRVRVYDVAVSRAPAGRPTSGEHVEPVEQVGPNGLVQILRWPAKG